MPIECIFREFAIEEDTIVHYRCADAEGLLGSLVTSTSFVAEGIDAGQ